MQSRLLPTAGMIGPHGHHLPESEIESRLQIQFAGLNQSERDEQIAQLLASHSQQRICLDDSLTVTRDGRTAGVLTIARQPDDTINLWPATTISGLHPEDAQSIRRLLYKQAVEFVDRSNSWIAQCLLAQHDVVTCRELHAAGFPRLTELVFQARSLSQPVTDVVSSEPVSHEPFDSGRNQQRFADVLERTWQGTLDCPELNGTRNGQAALAGHQLAGEFAPDRWLLFSLDGADAGVLLMTDHPDEQVWEVVYFGVACEARGRGLGRIILTEGLRRAQSAGAQEMVLAVDARNQPALRLYEEFDFRTFDRRIVHARVQQRNVATNQS
ncbi:MAG: GNAT family N-acetyltransferase [Planctomycetota bacterium]